MLKICTVTGSRADFGLLSGLLELLKNDPDIVCQLIVTGTHLSSKFGSTLSEIQAAGFDISEQVEMDLTEDSDTAIVKSMAKAMIGIADALDQLKPDFLVLLGDRFEISAAAQAALVLRIPIAHIHGGEITEGAIDDAIRHSITKLSHLHFASTETYRQRIIQMGEMPENVHNTGALGVDNIQSLPLLSQESLETELNFDLSGGPIFMVTYHPVTLDANPAKGIDSLLESLMEFPDARILITGANSDTGNTHITNQVSKFASDYSQRVLYQVSLGQLRYLSALKIADVVIGNSSSGIIEAPALGTPTVNIGRRQDGRLKAASVIDCKDTSEDIGKAITKALSSEFKRSLPELLSLHGNGTAAAQIVQQLKHVNRQNIMQKKFCDISGAGA